jgi:hypothetical protein
MPNMTAPKRSARHAWTTSDAGETLRPSRIRDRWRAAADLVAAAVVTPAGHLRISQRLSRVESGAAEGI